MRSTKLIAFALLFGIPILSQITGLVPPNTHAQATPNQTAQRRGNETGKQKVIENPLTVEDDPVARARFFENMFGPVTPETLDKREAVALREFNRWKDRMPRPFGAPMATTAQSSAIGVWFNLGPFSQPGQSYQESGRPTVILRHPTNPKLLYVAEAGGGLFRCTNADTTDTTHWNWEPLTDGLPATSTSGNIPIGAMALDPNDPNTIFIAMGDWSIHFATAVGRGFYISHDGGATWVQGGSLGNTYRSEAIIPLSSTVLLVATDAGLFKSTNGGQAFTHVSNSYGFKSLAASGGRISGAGHLGNFSSNLGLYYSDDQGATWQPSTLDASFTGVQLGGYYRRVELATTLANSGLVLGISADVKGLLKSTDGGKNWTLIRDPADKLFMQKQPNGSYSPDIPNWYCANIAIDPEDSNRIFASGSQSIFRSMDGGVTWTQICRGDRIDQHTEFQVLTPARDSQGRMVLWAGHDGGITLYGDPYRSTIPPLGQVDYSYLDTRMNRGIGTFHSYTVASTTAVNPADARSRLGTGTQDLGTRVRVATTTQNLDSSKEFAVSIGGDGFDSIFHPLNGNLMLGSWQGGEVLRSTNGGQTWSQVVQYSDYGGNSTFWTRLVPQSGDPTGNTLFHPHGKQILRSTDFGSIWTAMPVPTLGQDEVFNVLAVTPASTSTVAVGTSSSPPRLFITDDLGVTWRVSTLPNVYPFAIDVISPQIMYGGVAAFDPGNSGTWFWKSLDGGQTWNAADGGTNFPKGIPIFQIVQDPSFPNRIYLATEFGVYRTLNAGGAWERLGQGLPMIRTFSIYLAPDGSFLRAATYGRGVWEVPLAALPDAPTITSQPQAQSVAAGQAVVFNVVASGTGPLSYQWRKNSIDIPGSSSSSFTFVAKLADSGALFSVSVANAGGSALSANATLTVVPKNRDLNGDAQVNVLDLAAFMAAYSGPGISTSNPAADLDGDGDCDDTDLALLLSGI